MNVYSTVRKLAKSVRAQNRFSAVREINGIRLFENSTDLSQLQEIYLSYLYMYEGINRDIIIENISKKVLDCDLYEDCYMMWKRKNTKKSEITDSNTKKDLKLIQGKTIIFPKKD